MELITERYATKISGLLTCFDRIVLTGTLLRRSYPAGMEKNLQIHKIRCFDFQEKFAKPLAERIKSHAVEVAKAANLEIEYLGGSTIRKEAAVQEKLLKRGTAPGLVCILSNVEGCRRYMAHYFKDRNHTGLKMKSGQCLTYYFYFIDELLGLCFLRVPTWIPCQMLFYFNGHNYLANQLKGENIQFKMADNCFTQIGDFARANELASQIDPRAVRERIRHYVSEYVPMIEDELEDSYCWSIRQLELSSDITFKSPDTLPAMYEHLVSTSMHTVKAPNVASFLGMNLPNKDFENIGSSLKKTVEGVRLRHNFGAHSIKMYDKYNLILRIETTTDKVNKFQAPRMVHHRDGSESMKVAPVKKAVDSLNVLFKIMSAANRRYHEFISSLETFSAGREKLKKVTSPVRENNRTYKGIDFFNEEDDALLRTISAGEFTITGFRNMALRQKLNKSTAQISRMMKRLLIHGIIKRIGKTYKYYLTVKGRQISSIGIKLKELYLIPQLNFINE